jgi:hypothetical protein
MSVNMMAANLRCSESDIGEFQSVNFEWRSAMTFLDGICKGAKQTNSVIEIWLVWQNSTIYRAALPHARLGAETLCESDSAMNPQPSTLGVLMLDDVIEVKIEKGRCTSPMIRSRRLRKKLRALSARVRNRKLAQPNNSPQ